MSNDTSEPCSLKKVPPGSDPVSADGRYRRSENIPYPGRTRRLQTPVPVNPVRTDSAADGVGRTRRNGERATGSEVFDACLAAGDGSSLRQLRAGVRAWLEEHRAPPEVIDDFVLAVSEAAGNGIEYAPAGTSIKVRGTFARDQIRLRVTSTGPWRRTGPTAERGRGLEIIRSLTERLSILEGGGVVTLDMRQRLPPGGIRIDERYPLHGDFKR
jgi:anti-sigma regulatory factor (Ser/Thr protein kinase)